MPLSDEEYARIRQEERARTDARDEARKRQYPRLIAVAVGWAIALMTLALFVAR